MGMFDMSPEQVIEWREKLRQLAADHVDEEVLAAAPFRHGGAGTRMAISKLQLGGIAYAGSKLLSKKKAGGLPDQLMLVVTPTRLYAFKYGFKGRNYKIKDEAAVWERAGLRISTDRSGSMTALTIESPAEGEKATLVGGGIKDDPLTQGLIEILEGATPAAT
jgi:hypothetical protein